MNDPNSIREQVEGRIREEAAQQAAPAAETIDSEFVLRCLQNNERGDGILFAAMHRDKFVYVKSRDEKTKAWMRYNGHHWEVDRADYSHAAVENVALRYLTEAEQLKPQINVARAASLAADAALASAKAVEKDVRGRDHQPEELAAAEKSRIEAEQDAHKAKSHLKWLTYLQKEYTDRADKLRTVRGAKNCLEWAHKIGDGGLFIYGDEIDQHPWLLACKNGVINLRTGELEPGRPHDYLVRAIPVQFKGLDLPAPTWDKFMLDIHCDANGNPHQDLHDFVCRLLGYYITGAISEQIYGCFIGEGANGKGTLFETLREIMGELAWNINPEMILDSKVERNSAAASPDIMALHGRRLSIASETDEGRKISGAKLKKLTGGDTQTGRNLFDIFDTNFRPTHKIALYTNHPPKGLASDFALRRRLRYVQYLLRYVDDPDYEKKIDPLHAHLYRQKEDLEHKIREEKSAILGRLVQYCLWYQRDGLKPPAIVLDAVEALRKSEDYVENFIDAVCQRLPPKQPDQWLQVDRVTFKTFYERFTKWYGEEQNEDKKYLPSKKKVGEQLRRKGFHMPSNRDTGGVQYIYGLVIEGVFE